MNSPITSLPLKPPRIINLRPIPNIPGLPKIDNGAQLVLDNTITAPNELVAGLLHQGTKGVLASSSKAGKTWILLDLALSVATGAKFLRWDTSKGKVLFINFEIQRVFIKSRLEVLMQRRSIQTVEGLDFWNLRGTTADFEALVANVIKEVQGQGYALIVLDPIYKAMVGRSENTASSVGALCYQLERLVEQTGAAVVFAHHFTKGPQANKTAIDRISGSGVFARDPDSIITFTEHQTEGCFTVEMTLRNLPPQNPFVVEWQFPLMVQRPDLDPDCLKDGEEAQEDELEPLLKLLDETPLTTSEWEKLAIKAGYSRADFYRKKAKIENTKRLEFDKQSKTWKREVSDT